MYYVEVRDEHDNLSVVLSAERIEIIANGGKPMKFPPNADDHEADIPEDMK